VIGSAAGERRDGQRKALGARVDLRSGAVPGPATGYYAGAASRLDTIGSAVGERNVRRWKGPGARVDWRPRRRAGPATRCYARGRGDVPARRLAATPAPPAGVAGGGRR
jgi:hypothetical protein